MRQTSVRARLLLPRFLIALLSGLLVVSLGTVPANAAGEDTLPPVIVFTPSLSGRWYTNPVTFNVKATDSRLNDSGVNRAFYELTGATTSALIRMNNVSGANVTIGGRGTTYFNVEAFDNWEHRTFVNPPVRVDLDDPEATINLSGTVFERGQTATVTYSCSDFGAANGTGSGVASCSGQGGIPSGGALDTSTVGEHTFAVTAKDNAGRSSTKEVTYQVILPQTPPLFVVTPPTIAGPGKIGVTLTGSPTVTFPASPSSCEWTTPSSVGVLGTGNQYVVPADLLNKTIYFGCTNTLAGYLPATRQSPGLTITEFGDLPDGVVTNRQVDGPALPGATLTASYTIPNRPDGTQEQILWLLDNTVIPGATGATYVIKPTDLGHVVSAQVRVTEPRYNPRQYLLGERDLTDKVAPRITLSPQPPAGWLTGPFTSRLTVADGDPLDTGVSSFWYNLDGGPNVQLPVGGGDVIVNRNGASTLSVHATDVKGNRRDLSYDVRIDLSNPLVDITSPIDGHTYAVGDELVANYECADQPSGVADCDAALINGETADTSIPGDYTFTVTATDNAGREKVRTVHYRVVARLAVATPSQIVGSGRVGEELVGHAATFQPTATVTCHWSRSGNRITLDGVDRYTPVAADLNTTLTYDCVGTRSNYADEPSVSVGRVVQPGDLADGLVTDKALTGAGLVGQMLTASYAIANRPADLQATVRWLRDGTVIPDATGLAYVVREADLYHHVRAVLDVSRPGYTDRRYILGEVLVEDPHDDLAPLVMVDPEPVDGWLRNPATYHLSASDDRLHDTGLGGFGYELSGATEDSGDLDLVEGGDVTVSAEGVTHVLATAIDGADNTGTKEFDVSIDLTDPRAEITGLVDGAELKQGQEVAVSYTCADDQSDVDTCDGDVEPGDLLDTAALGEHTFTVVATDKSGRTTTRVLHYDVIEVELPQLQVVDEAEITGSGRVGEELVGTPATFEPAAEVTCRWLSNGVAVTADGVNTFTPSGLNLGQTITFECDGVLDGYAGQSSPSVGRLVTAGDLGDGLVTDEDVEGVGQVGRTLTASYVIVDRPADLKTTVVWLRDLDVIEDATDLTYSVRPQDLDHTISAVLVVNRRGYAERRYPLGEVDVTLPPDAVPPIVGVDPEPVDGWLSEATTYRLTARDDRPGDTGVDEFGYELTGAMEADGALDPDGDDLVLDQEGLTRVRATAVDGAGNEGAANFEVRIDLTDPELTVNGVSEGEEYELGEVVDLDIACADDQSLIDSCAWDSEDPLRLDTGEAGEQTLTATATDRSGRTTTQTVHYRVIDNRPQLQLVDPAQIEGTGKVGEVLTGTAATFEPTATVACRFVDGDGEPLSEVGVDRFTPTADSLGDQVAYECRGTHEGYRTTTTTSPRTEVVLGDLSDGLVTDRRVDGSDEIGSTLTASYTIADRPADLEDQVLWLRDGEYIAGSAGPTYVLGGADFGTTVSAVVVVSRPGYEERRFPLGERRLFDAEGPVIAVDPAPTDAWRQGPITYDLQATDDRTYDFGVTSFGYVVSGATQDQGGLDPVSGGQITIDREGTTHVLASARDAAENESARTFDVRIDLTDPEASIFGIEGGLYRPGEEVRVSYVCSDEQSGIETCAGDVDNGEPIDTSTIGTHTFTVTATDRSGRQATAVASYEVYGTMRQRTPPAIEGTGRVGEPLVSSLPTFEPEATAHECDWYRNGVWIAGAERDRYTPVAGDIDAVITFGCFSSREHYREEQSMSDGLQVEAGELGAGLVTDRELRGSGRVGATLRASYTITNRPADLEEELVWLRDGEPIEEAAGATYVVQPGDLDHTIAAVVDVSRPGYADRRYSVGQVDVTALADELEPVLTVDPAPTDDWLQDSVTYDLRARDDREHDTGVASFEYELSGDSDGAGDLDVTEGGEVTIEAEGETGVLASAFDGAGNRADVRFDVRIDRTDPMVDVSGLVDGAELGLGQEVHVSYECSDVLSGVASCDGDVADGEAIDTTTEGAHTFTVAATDNSGRTTTHEVGYSVVVDTEDRLQVVSRAGLVGSGAVGVELTGAPAIFDPVADVTCGWLRNGEPIAGAEGVTYVPTAADLDSTIMFACLGTLEGYADEPSTSVGRLVVEGDLGDGLVTDAMLEGTGQVGETLTASYAIVDRPADLQTEVVWLRDFDVIEDATGSTYVARAEDLDHTVRAVLVADRPGYAEHRYLLGAVDVFVPADPMAPVVTVSPEPTEGWSRAARTYHLTASDNVGVASFSYVLTGDTEGSGDLDPVEGGDVTVGAEGTTRVVAVATDEAGNEGAADFAVRLDLTDPTVDVSGLVEGAELGLGQEVHVSYECSDVLSGVASCDGDVDDGEAIDTATEGAHTFTVVATDNSGRTTTRAVGYTVVKNRLQLVSRAGLVGSGAVGVELTGVPAVFDPVADVTCEWLRGDNVVGTGGSYTPTAADLGATITYSCVGTRAGYVDEPSVSVGRLVVAGDLADGLVTDGTVDGDGLVGATLTASYSIADRPADLQAHVAWLRDGEPIEGAAGVAYVVRTADVGHTVRAVLDVSRPGYADRRYPLGAVEVPEPADETAPVVTVTPEPTDDWSRDAVTYDVSASDDRGVESLSYVLSGDSEGQGDLDPVEGGEVTVETEGTTDVVVTATDAAGNEGTADFTVRMDLTDPELTLNGAEDGAEYALGQEVPLDVACADDQSGIALCVWDSADPLLLDTDTAGEQTLTATATDLAGRTTERVVHYRVVAEEPQLQVAIEAEIVGSGAVGVELIGHAAVFSPNAALSTCEWLRNGVAITGAGADRYTPVAADLGSTITYECVGSLDGYLGETSTSVRLVVAGDLADGLVTDGAVAGQGVAGATLTASYSIADRPADLQTEVVWLRDGDEIDGASGSTYVVRAADVGHTVRAVLDVSRPGYAERRYPLGAVEVPEPADEVAPTVTVDPEPTEGWLRAARTFHLSAADDTGVESFSYEMTGATVDAGDLDVTEGGDVEVTAEGATHVVVTAVDAAGNEDVAEFDVRIDLTDPTLTLTGVEDGDEYPLDEVVDVTYACADGQSTIDTCVADLPDGGALATDTVGAHSFSATATDESGRVTTRTVHYNVVADPDQQLRVLTRSRVSGSGRVGDELVGTPATYDPAAGRTACWWLRDGVAFTPIGVHRYTPVASDMGTTLVFRCVGARDGYANQASRSLPVRVLSADAPADTLAPTVTVTPEPVDGWLRDAAIYHLEATDDRADDTGVTDFSYQLSGATTESGHIDLADGEDLSVDQEGTTRVRATATDRAGNASDVDFEVHVDLTDPMVDVSGLVDGAELGLGQEVHVSYTCADGQSDIATCEGDVEDGDAVDTTTAGAHTFTVVATDNSGRTTTRAVGYTVAEEAEARLQVVARAEVAGSGAVGVALTGTPAVFDPAAEVTCRWLRDDAPIAGAEGTSYTPVATDLRSTITYDCMGVLDGYADEPSTSLGRVVVEGELADGLVTEASLTGDGVVGEALTASYSIVDKPADLQDEVVWLRDGAEIEDASGTSYVVRAADAGHTVRAMAEVSRPGYAARRYLVGEIAVVDPTVDAEEPTVTVSPEPTSGWLLDSVTYHLAVSDNVGVESFSYELTGATERSGDLDPVDGGDITVDTDGLTVVKATARDAAGNVGLATFEVRIDRSDPVVSIEGLVDGAEIVVGTEAHVRYECTDVVSKIETCEGPVTSGDVIDTETVGDKTFTVTGTDFAGRKTTRSVGYRVVAAPPLQVLTAAEIAGPGRVGEELVGTPATYDPAAKVSCRWLRNGEAITEPGVASYVPVAGDLTATITYRCVGTLDGHTDQPSEATRIVSAGAFGDGLVTGGGLAGTGEVGSTLTASYAITNRPGDLGTTVLWLRDDAVIEGATGAAYVVRVADVGHTVRAVLAVTRPGYTERRYPLGSVAGRKIAVKADGGLAFTGASQVGQRLTAAPPAVRPAAGGAPVATALQWLRDGVPIPGATAASYLVQPADLNHKIGLRMTSTADAASYDPLVVESAAGPAVAKGKTTLKVKAKVKKRKVRLVLTATVGELKPSGKVVVKVGKKVVARGNLRAGKVTLKLKKRPPGKVKLVVRYVGGPGFAAATVKAKVKVR